MRGAVGVVSVRGAARRRRHGSLPHRWLLVDGVAAASVNLAWRFVE